MTISEFERLEKEPEKIEVGQIFLPDKLAEQKDTKQAGQWITYYIITDVKSIKPARYEYSPKYELLVEDIKQ